MRWVLLAGVFSLLLFSGCLDALFVNPNQPNTTNVACESFTDLASKDACFRDRGVKDKNPNECVNVSPENRNECYSKVADAAGDGRICLSMTPFDAQISCVDAHPEWVGNGTPCDTIAEGPAKEICNRHAARVLKNEVFCYAAGSMKNDCLSDVAKFTNNPDLCDLIGSSDAKEACFIATAVNAKNSVACQKIVAQEPRENCLDGVAQAQGNAKLCESIETPALRAGCLAKVQAVIENTGNCTGITDIAKRDACFRDLAKTSQQVDTCTKIIGQTARNDCYAGVAQAIHDESICENIVSDPVKKQTCLSGIATSGGTADSCGVLDGAPHDLCVTDVAVKTKNPALCQQLFVVTDTINYADECFIKVASAKGDYTACLGIHSLASREDCLNAVGVKSSSEAACAAITTQDVQEACYAGVALGESKSAVCERITTKAVHDDCIKKIALASKNASLCEGITDTLTQDACYSEVSIVLKDKSICDKIVNKSQRDPCILSIATSLNDWQYCQKISSTNPEIQQECLSTVAGKIGSTEPCTLIPAQVAKGECYAKAGLTGANFAVCTNVPLKQVVDPIEAHLARDTCWFYMADKGHGADLCANIYSESLKASCHG